MPSKGQPFLSPPATPVPFTLGAAIPVNFQNVSHFDGVGNLTTPTGVDTVGGLPPEFNVPTVGTYTVNPDCTGTLQLQTDHAPIYGGPHMHTAFITILKDKFLFTFTDPGGTGSGFGERMKR